MNPIQAIQGKGDTPLIQEEEYEAIRKRTVANCILFTLVGVFVFLLACIAVYTAIAMGLPVEKRQVELAKSEALKKIASVNTDQKQGNLLIEESSESELDLSHSDNSHPRLRIQIFIKGKKDRDSSGEVFERKHNKTEDNYPSIIPKSHIFFKKLIFRNPDLNKAEIDSSEDVSQGSEEEIIHFKPLNPLDALLNLIRLPEEIDDPVKQMVNVIEKSANEPKQESNVPQALKQILSGDQQDKSEESHNNKRPQIFRFEQRYPMENGQIPFDPLKHFASTLSQIFSKMEQNAGSSEKSKEISTQVTKSPPVIFHFFRIPLRNRQQTSSPDTLSPILFNQRNPYFSYNPINPLLKQMSEHNTENIESSSKAIEFTSAKPTLNQSAKTESATSESVEKVSSETSGEETKTEGQVKEVISTELPVKEQTFRPVPKKENSAPMINGINTENIKPFENFINHLNK